jgi:hypothetical protein
MFNMPIPKHPGLENDGKDKNEDGNKDKDDKEEGKE